MTGETRTRCYIHGIGTAVPEQSLSADQVVDVLDRACPNARSARLLRRIAGLTRIDRRHLAALDRQFEVGDGEPLYPPAAEQPHGPGMGRRTAVFDRLAGPLVCRALSVFPPRCLAGVTTLVTATCTQAASPGLEQPILLNTPVPPTADRWNLGFMGCSAALAAVRLAWQTAAPDRRALVVACELSSLHFQYTDELDQMTANLLFADGAAAAVLSPEPSWVRIVDCQCVTLPRWAGHMLWFAGDHGLQLRLAQELPDTIEANLPRAVTSFFRRGGIAAPAVDHWIVHPGGPQILDAVEHSLHLAAGALDLSRSVLRRYGNMSSPTILFVLKELLAAGAVGRTMALAFGPGLTVEMVLIEIEP